MNNKLTDKQHSALIECAESKLGYISKSKHPIQTLRSLEKKGLGKVVHGLFFYINEKGRATTQESEQ